MAYKTHIKPRKDKYPKNIGRIKSAYKPKSEYMLAIDNLKSGEGVDILRTPRQTCLKNIISARISEIRRTYGTKSRRYAQRQLKSKFGNIIGVTVWRIK